jgi:hypothetical protein
MQALALAALVVAVVCPVLPAQAQATMTLSVDPLDPRPGEPITVDGDLADDCGTGGTYRVTLTYTQPSGDTGQVVATGVLADPPFGTFSATLDVPDDAVADDGEDESTADVSAVVTCTGTTTPVTSPTVELSIAPHTGVLDVQPERIDAGDPLVVSGTSCYGGEFFVVYGPAGDDWIAEEDGTSDPATRTFQAEIATDPDLPGGEYEFFAACPGTDYEPVTITIVGAPDPTPTPTRSRSASPTPTTDPDPDPTGGPTPGATTPGTGAPAAPPATPVDGNVSFTG